MSNESLNSPTVLFCIVREKDQVRNISTTSPYVNHFLDLMKISKAYNTWVSYAQEWCDAKYRPSSIHSRRAVLLNFFLWFQERYPCPRLDQVSRLVALEYSRFLKEKVEAGIYSRKYRNDLYRGMRLFFDYVIDEGLETSPDRNPFGKNDLPPDPDPVPRYISDRELRMIMEYCDQGASLKEKTVVITLLHTGLRASELANLAVSDIVQIQGKWKLHVREGKGLKDRIIPLTPKCLETLQTWQEKGWEKINNNLFTRFGRVWQGGRHGLYHHP